MYINPLPLEAPSHPVIPLFQVILEHQAELLSYTAGPHQLLFTWQCEHVNASISVPPAVSFPASACAHVRRPSLLSVLGLQHVHLHCFCILLHILTCVPKIFLIPSHCKSSHLCPGQSPHGQSSIQVHFKDRLAHSASLPWNDSSPPHTCYPISHAKLKSVLPQGTLFNCSTLKGCLLSLNLHFSIL